MINEEFKKLNRHIASRTILSVKSILEAAKKSPTNLVIDGVDYKQYVRHFVKQYKKLVKSR